VKKSPDLTSLNISLPRDQRDYVAECVAEGGYGSASEFVRELIRKDAKERAQDKLQAMLLAGLDSGAPMRGSAKFFADLRARIDELARPKRKKGRKK
jgi:antitoxin ParD1/3/4